MQYSKSVDTRELTAELDFSVKGGPATRQVYISQPDKSLPGGQKQLTDLFVAPERRSTPRRSSKLAELAELAELSPQGRFSWRKGSSRLLSGSSGRVTMPR